MATKPAEQVVEAVKLARKYCESIPKSSVLHHETQDRHERAMRLYIQSNLPDKLVVAISEYRCSPEFSQEVLDRCLYFGAYYGFSGIVSTLLSNGASVSYTSPSGHTCLMKAVGSRNLETVQVLVAAKCDPNQKTPSGLSALDIAVSLKEDEMVTFFNSL